VGTASTCPAAGEPLSRPPDGASAAEDPIGVFDSGVGGLSVLREIRRELPGEDLLYVADSGYAPYGDRASDFIEKRAAEIVGFLLKERAKAVVVACNTATGVAIETLRSEFHIPLIGIEPAVKPAASATRSGVVGVLATNSTLSSAKFSRLRGQYGGNVTIVTQACPGLVEQVEKGELSGEGTRSRVEKCIRPLLESGADILVLGCTHYPFLSEVIREVAGPAVTVIDPAVAVARELRRVLQAAGLLCWNGHQGTERFWTSGPAEGVPVIARLWTKDVDVQRLTSC
jgi:glutamate racemase